jgi:hypothetical protein
MNHSREIWNSTDPERWDDALKHYWVFVKPSNLDLEREINELDAEDVNRMNADGWYEFLKNKYFRWKYTAPNRYATTTKFLKRYREEGNLGALLQIKERLFTFDKDDIEAGLKIATLINGLGTAGASGLLAILFPVYFGTVDQFVVKALSCIPELPEVDRVRSMNPLSLNIRDAVVLIPIMRRKATELNDLFCADQWTPRRIDMVLWGCSR